MGKRKNIYITEDDEKLLPSLKADFGPTDSDVYRIGLRALLNVRLRNAQRTKEETEAKKKEFFDKVGEFQICPVHGIIHHNCWNLHI